MAMELVDEIRRVEREADLVEKQAREKAAAILDETARKVNDIQKQAVAQAAALRGKALEDAERQAAAIREAAHRQAEEDVRELDCQAAARQEEAIRQVIAALTGR